MRESFQNTDNTAIDNAATRRAERHAERRYTLEVQRNLTRNFFAHLAHGLLGQTGFRLLHAPTFLPAYLLMLSGSDLIVGLALSIQAMGTMLTPLLGATLIEHRAKVLPIGFLVGAGMRLMVLGIALCGFFLTGTPAVVGLCLCLFLFGACNGVQGVIFNFLMSKVIPVRKRGRLSGIRNFLAGLTAASVAALSGTYLIGETPDPVGYSQTFLLAFVLTSIGLCMLLIVREPIPPKRPPKTSVGARFAQLPAMLRADPRFAFYIAARAAATMGRMAMPFYVLYAGASVGLSGTTLAVVTVAFTVSGTLSNLVWGVMADRWGFRRVFVSSVILWLVATVALLQVDDLWLVATVFAMLGFSVQGFQNASVNLTLEFGVRQDLPMRIAIANTISEAAAMLGPLLGGVLATIYNYEVVFITSMAFLCSALLIMLRYVSEPRYDGKAT